MTFDLDPSLAPLADRRERLLASALGLAPFEGWNARLLALAEADAGLAEGTAALAYPSGVVDLIDFWALRCDEAAAGAYLGPDAGRVRDRITQAVRARILAIGEDNREAARRALARLALPDASTRGVQITWRAADRIWRGLGDPSTDAAFYSKRVILSGVIASTLGAWLSADAGRDEEAWAHLDRRIEDVMRFERLKARVKRVTAHAPDLPGLLARVRYGDRGAQ